MHYAYIALLAFLPISIQSRNISQRLGIIQGENSLVSNFSYQMSLFINEFFFCGASIISPNFGLTAGEKIFKSFFKNSKTWIVKKKSFKGSNLTHFITSME